MTGALGALLQDALRGGGRVRDAALGEDVPGDALLRQAEAVAAGLRRLDIQPHEPVQVRVGNRPGDLAALLGVWLADGVAVPIHVDAAPQTIAAIGAAASARVLVDGAAVERIGADPPPPRALLRDAALIVFTSGTTGRPKGVVIPHDALAGKIEVLEALLSLGPGDVVLLPLQLMFIFGLWVAVLALRSRSRLLLVQKFSRPAVEMGLLQGATILAAVPSMLRVLVAAEPLSAASLRMVLTGGEALGTPLSRQLRACWPAAAIYDLYGSTETGSCDFSHQPQPDHGTSIGRPTRNVRYRILDAAGADTAPGEPGELAILTPYGMAGYLDDPELTSASYAAGYYRTGDLACRQADGSVWLVGRLKEIVSHGGNKIAPQEIDNLLCTYPGIAAALSAGRPDARLGESLHSVVVLTGDGPFDLGGLRLWLSDRLERFKVPKSITVVGHLPTGPTGKASRAALRSLLMDGTLE